MPTLAQYSIGVGDRFAHQAAAQLRACAWAAASGVEVIPVWNKSQREHSLIGSHPAEVRAAAEMAVRESGWPQAFHVDADHIRMETVDAFLPHADFFTIDVADFIGKPAPSEAVQAFLARHRELSQPLGLPGLGTSVCLNEAAVAQAAGQYLLAVSEAARLYRHIAAAKGANQFITEVSFDESPLPQAAGDLLVILAALADSGVPVQTIAPKFSGRFNKGVDYEGDLVRFEREFREDLAVIQFAVRQYGLPDNLKLSVHSGSDKFSLYPCMRRTLREFRAGVHLKTAGTTWLEELLGLAESGGAALIFAKDLYRQAVTRIEPLCGPYSTVIAVDRSRLPSPAAVAAWSADEFCRALRHDPSDAVFNPHLRQLLHVSYPLAAQAGIRFLELLEQHQETIARRVTENLFVRHIQPLFMGPGANEGTGGSR